MPHGHRPNIDSLDGLRGLAALGVLILHLLGRFGLSGWPNRFYLAVPLFFVISGYVIARSYEDRLREGMSLSTFARIRAIRLYPMLLASCLIATFSMPIRNVAMAALVIPSLVGTLELFPANGPIWSLFIEIWGNFAHALFVRQLNRIVLATLVAMGGIGTMIAVHASGDLAVGWANGNFSGGVSIFLFSYFAGVAIWRAECAGFLTALPRLPLVVPVCAYMLAVAAPLPGNGLTDAAIVLLLFPLIVLLTRTASLSERTASTCRAAGRLSYPLYVLHYPIVTFATDHLRWATPAQQYALLAPLAVVCVAISMALLYFYDEPLRRYLSAIFRQRQAWTLGQDVTT
jgi:peptidoglycan/LPS O-acetylase OafA/YrhL